MRLRRSLYDFGVGLGQKGAEIRTGKMALFDWFRLTKGGAYDRGILAFDEGRHEEAIQYFEECLASGEEDAATIRLAEFYISECYASIGSAALRGGNFERGLSYIEKALARHPNYPDLHYLRAVALRKLGRRAEARASVDKALELNPRFAKAVMLEGILLIEAGDVSEGTNRIGHAVSLDGSFDNDRLRMGLRFLASGDIGSAVGMLEAVTSKTVEDSMAHARLADESFDKGLYDTAAAEYLKALSITPNYADLRCKYGICLMEMGQYVEALDQFETALRCNPRYTDALYHCGRALMACGRYEEAVQALGKLLGLDENYPGASELRRIAARSA